MNTRTHALTLSLAALLAGCGGGGGGGDTVAPLPPTPEPAPATQDFTHGTTEAVSVSITVTDDEGQPLDGVALQLVSALRAPGPGEEIEDLIEGELFFQATTGADGTAAGTALIPLRHGEVDLIAHLAGHAATYTVPELKDLWGPFAPSLRRTFTREADLDLALTLTETASR